MEIRGNEVWFTPVDAGKIVHGAHVMGLAALEYYGSSIYTEAGSNMTEEDFNSEAAMNAHTVSRPLDPEQMSLVQEAIETSLEEMDRVNAITEENFHQLDEFLDPRLPTPRPAARPRHGYK